MNVFEWDALNELQQNLQRCQTHISYHSIRSAMYRKLAAAHEQEVNNYEMLHETIVSIIQQFGKQKTPKTLPRDFHTTLYWKPMKIDKRRFYA